VAQCVVGRYVLQGMAEVWQNDVPVRRFRVIDAVAGDVVFD
jgi:hypothetical protein